MTPPKQRPDIILCFGDSLTKGIKETGESYPATLQKLLRDAGHNVQVENAGNWGDTSDKMLARLPRAISEAARLGRLAFILVLGGTNDILRSLGPTAQSMTRLRQLHDQASKAPYMPRVGICTLPPLRCIGTWEQSRLALNAALRAEVPAASGSGTCGGASKRRFLVDLAEVGVSGLCPDGVHYTAEGYDEFARRVFDVLDPIMANEQKPILVTTTVP